VFDAQTQDAPAGSEAVFADAAFVASQALVRMSGQQDGDKALGRLGRVLFMPGPKETVAASKGVLHITINVSQGLAGRPSSARIIEVAMKSR